MPYRVGQTATNPKTGQKVVWDGQNWAAPAGQTLNQTATGGGRSQQQDTKFLNELTQQAQDAAEVERIYNRAAGHIQTLKTGPYRGKFLQAATPDDGGGLLDTIGSVVVGVPARMAGAITPKDTDTYQKLQSLQQYRVLAEQTRQKGVQTEGDAARIKLAEISPTKTVNANMDIINNGLARLRRVQARAAFAQQWAHKYGLHGTNEQGQNIDQVWANDQENITNSMINNPRQGTEGITILSRKKVR